MSFIHEDFMLHNETARRLYHETAKHQPIIDYHCHLNPQEIAENKQFRNLTEVWLGGDHYKWRVLRSNGVDEKLITGKESTDEEKFAEWARTVPYTIGNPVYHWTHLELKRFFHIDETLSPKTADKIWNTCNELLATEDFRAQSLIERSNVRAVCTTDDPMDDLRWHKQIREQGFSAKVYPTFRPDKAVEIGKDTFLPYMETMGADSYQKVLEILTKRMEFFHENGCRLADHGLETAVYAEGDAAKVWEKRMAGKELTKEEIDVYKTAVLQHCGREYARLGWTMQLHMGAIRNNNTRMFKQLGPDTGFDSIHDLCVAEPLSRFLDSLDKEDTLPKTILYTLNPRDNYVLGTMLGNFQKAPFAGKIQFGSGWWFNDQRDGMVEQMKALANLGLLSRFVGMLTDSRSFLSYPRHEYFRRILCNLIGEWVEKGEYPADWDVLPEIIADICYGNAERYFGLEL